MQPRIYAYKITFEEVPYYYYGSKKEKYYNQEYWGSPKTNKWCWELYTPKKQILEIFDYTDEGYRECRKVEDRLIRPVLNDYWCLNEKCGGTYSINSKRKSGKLGGRKGGLIGGKYVVDNKLGIHSLTKEEKSFYGKKGAISTKLKGVGIHSLTYDQRVMYAKKQSSQRWMCTVTGYISTSAGLSHYQRKRNIDTVNRIKLDSNL
jgi:hypothetical protein